MQNKLIIVAAAIFFAGCATTREPVINTVIQRVEIPIAIPCKVEVPAKPEFNFDKLTIEQNVFDKTKSVLADRHLHLAYETELLAALNSCIK